MGGMPGAMPGMGMGMGTQSTMGGVGMSQMGGFPTQSTYGTSYGQGGFGM